MVLIGATLYTFEIPNYFNWVVRKTNKLYGLTKITLAIAYFNPLWIARHLFYL